MYPNNIVKSRNNFVDFAVCGKYNKIKNMAKLTAVYKKSGKWYLAWIEEIPGVNTQGKTLKEAKENLKEALSLILETNKTLSEKEFAGQRVIREPFPYAFA